jgi:hypothetical protein
VNNLNMNRGTYLMLKRLPVLLTGILLLISATMFAHAQGGALPNIAAVTNGQLYLYGPGRAQAITGGGYQRFSNIVWSPNGQSLAFTIAGNGYTLMLSDRNGSAPVQLAQGVSYMPVTFNADGSRVIYTVEGSLDEITSGDSGPLQPMRVYSQELNAGSQPEQIAQFGFGVGCGGGSPFPMDGVYNAEAGFGGRALTFAYTDFGILHSSSCAGTGLALLNLNTGESAVIDPGLSNAVLSPDRTRVAAIRQGSLVVINLADLSQQNIGVAAGPDQLAWGDNNTLYYSVRNLLPEPLPLSEAEAQVYSSTFGVAANTLPQYSVELHQTGLGGGDSVVFSGPGWAIGRIFASGGSIYFSLVPNGEAWVEALASGEIDFTTNEGFIHERQTVAATLLRLEGGGYAVELAPDIGQATPNPAG